MTDTSSSPIAAPCLDDLKAARERIKGKAVLTPLLRFPVLDEVTGGTILVKPENLQRTGSFKFRGAFNALSQVQSADRPKGVVACSSGNHAQGIAESARLLGMPAIIVMPEDAPIIKLERTQALGAKVVTYDRVHEDRDAIAHKIQQETGAIFVHPYNNPHVIAGQGTIGLELAEQAAALRLKPDVVLACTGGGGLSAGVALGISEGLPRAEFRTVEPVGFDDFKRSLETGRIQANEKVAGSLCDAILTKCPGDIPFSVLKERAGDGLAISDDEALAAVAFAFRELKLVVEPGGAAALAAVLARKIDCANRIVSLVLTGGNIDATVLNRALDAR
ncbi:threo-3-hydroxyaspartate ammonia-lyase [Roseibium sp. TrichSKD4]|uniref:threonine ammonia-lyase n=1 Tax=Roseibium sp. TrichSKD4 TaxID=744980 RepID=UPI0001E574AB|nr:threonine/serine dehydratase [Roseibium sp. TrichSKD4]EFO30818.1 threo-3-hydroxyaspartate ammonia-lyase [Roseibium sp. TrichSKD4]